jgi:hypothetical protein
MISIVYCAGASNVPKGMPRFAAVAGNMDELPILQEFYICNC